MRSLLKGYESDLQSELFHPIAEYSEDFCGLPEGGMQITFPPPPPLQGGWPGEWAGPGSSGDGGPGFNWPNQPSEYPHVCVACFGRLSGHT